MSEQIKTAVILAAGMGNRLGKHNNNQPKGLLRIGTLPIIHDSINKLRRAKIENIVVVTGFRHDLYDEYFDKNSLDIHVVKNLEYESSNTLSSLSKTRYEINQDFLLLESDIIYEDEQIFAIHDINPVAKVHILIIPKKKILTINDLSEEDINLIVLINLNYLR